MTCSRILTLASSLAFLGFPALAASPSEIWQTIPGLPDVAETAECAQFDVAMESVEAAAAEALIDAQLAMAQMPMVAAVSDDQGQAIEQLLDYSLQECVTGAETVSWTLIENARTALAEESARLENERADAVSACGSEMSDGYAACYTGVAATYQEKMRELANRHLDAISLEFAAWRGEAEQCLMRRDAAVARFEAAGVSGPFAAQSLNVKTISWALVGANAQTSNELCSAVFDAAHAMDVDG